MLDNHSHEILEIECREAMAILGVKSENIHVYGYSVREFTYKRQEILEELVKLKTKYNPNIVFCPSLKDLHQDHHVIAEEVLRCFKQKSVMMFELSWNQLNFSPETFIEVNEFDLQAKLDAIGSYKTQARKDYVKRKEELFRGLAIKHGISINVEYAEAFEQPRNIFLIDENVPLTKARMMLAIKVGNILKEGLALLGVSAPDEM